MSGWDWLVASFLQPFLVSVCVCVCACVRLTTSCVKY